METALTDATRWIDEDLATVQGMARGDETALRALYARHGRQLLAHAFRLVGSREIAEDVVQESLLAAWRAAGSFRGDARVSTWLLGIVHRQALNAIRRKKLPVVELIEAEELPDDAPSPDVSAVLTDRQRAVRAGLAGLSRDNRATVELVFYHGLSLAEVAQVSGCPVGTVKSRLNHAKAQLRAQLDRAGLRAEDLL